MEIIRFYDPATNTLVSTISRCITADVPGDPLPPPPPSAAEVFERLPLPMPEVHTSPPEEGLVGFETWLWWGESDELAPVTVSVGGWTATVTPELQSVEWDMGNGDVVEGDGPGTEEEPSATYVYERQCECEITITLTWGGTVSLSHPWLGAPIVEESAGVSFSTTEPYDVIEREAVIVG